MEVSFIRVFLLCCRAVPAAWHSIYSSPFYARSPLSLSFCSPVMASVHIIVDGENENRENTEYAV